MEAKYDELTAMGAEVIAISTDSHYSQRAFARSKGFRFKFLSDYNREVASRLNGSWEVGDYHDVNRRRILVVDDKMLVRWEWTAPQVGSVADGENVREAVQEVVYE